MTYFITEALGHGFVGFPLTIFLPNPGISIFKLCLAYVTFMSYLGIGMSVCLHRYFSHQAFKTSRSMTFLLAVIGSLANQKGCLWWAANHRKHHKYCDQPGDPHSQTQDGYWFGFVGWSFVYQPVSYTGTVISESVPLASQDDSNCLVMVRVGIRMGVLGIYFTGILMYVWKFEI
jgi:fatty-acid desaturase